jgi:hypothetical protein
MKSYFYFLTHLVVMTVALFTRLSRKDLMSRIRIACVYSFGTKWGIRVVLTVFYRVHFYRFTLMIDICIFVMKLANGK